MIQLKWVESKADKILCNIRAIQKLESAENIVVRREPSEMEQSRLQNCKKWGDKQRWFTSNGKEEVAEVSLE